MWWALPLGYFYWYFDKFQPWAKQLIIHAFLLLASSEFLGYYMAEARHYSAVAAVTAGMIIAWLRDRPSIPHFLIISGFIPQLHIVSVPAYGIAVCVFLLHRLRDVTQKPIRFLVLGLTSAYWVLMAVVFLRIKTLSAAWQTHQIPAVDFNDINAYLKWSMDWFVHGTPLEYLIQVSPEKMIHSLWWIFPLTGTAIVAIVIKRNLLKSYEFPVIAASSIFLLIWPATVVLFFINSGTFSGERYSILFFVLFMFSLVYLWNKLLPGKIAFWIMCTILLFTIARNSNTKITYTTPDHRFVVENRDLLLNKKIMVLADTGSYAPAIPALSLIEGFFVGDTNFVQCAHGRHLENGTNVINEWATKPDTVVYWYGSTDEAWRSDSIWQYGGKGLYRVDGIPNENLCIKTGEVGECYQRCIKGKGVTDDGRSIPGITPHLDVYRK